MGRCCRFLSVSKQKLSKSSTMSGSSSSSESSYLQERGKTLDPAGVLFGILKKLLKRVCEERETEGGVLSSLSHQLLTTLNLRTRLTLLHCGPVSNLRGPQVRSAVNEHHTSVLYSRFVSILSIGIMEVVLPSQHLLVFLCIFCNKKTKQKKKFSFKKRKLLLKY